MENSKNPIINLDKGGMTVKVLDNIRTAAVGLALFLIPIFFLANTSQGLGFEKMILFYFLVLIGVVCWVTKGVIVGELSLKRTPLDIPILAVIVTFALSTIFSVSQKDSLIGSYGNSGRSLAAVLIFALFYYLVVNSIDGRRIRIWFWTFVSSTAILSVFSLLQLFKLFIIPAGITHNISFNTIGSLSGLSMVLVAMLPILSVAMSHMKTISPDLSDGKARLLKIALAIIITVDLVVLAMLSGFTFWPVAIASMVIVLMFQLSKVVKTSSGGLFVPIAIFFALIILLVMGSLSNFFNLSNFALPTEISLSRSASWGIAKSTLMKNPIFGSGPSTFYYDFSKFRDQSLNYSPVWDVRFDNASGSIFELLATVGSLGTLAALVLVLIALSIAFMAITKTDKKEEQPMMLAFFASFIAILMFSLLFSFNNSLILIGFLISALTVAAAVETNPEKFKALNLSFRASPNYALALAAVFLTVSAGVVVLFIGGLKIYMADVQVKKALAQSDVNQKIETMNKAITLAPYQDVYYLEQGRNYITLANQEAAGRKDQNAIATYLNQAIDNGKKAAIEINPNSANNIESLALIYENASFYTKGALELANELYKKEMELEPNNPVPYLRTALINMANSNLAQKEEDRIQYTEDAIKQYDAALAKKNDFGAAYYGKAIAYERLDKTNDAITELNNAVLSTSNNLDYRFELGRLLFNRGVVQPNLAQNASTDITQGQTEGDQLSVQPTQATGGTIKRNDDLNIAEQIFQSILSVDPNNANAHYSLALLYQKLGENDRAKAEVTTLLSILQDQTQKDAVMKQFPGLY